MTLHLMKLCVGIEAVEQLEQSQARRLKRGRALFHDTRMMPRRAPEVVDGGSLYWVVKGYVTHRQQIEARLLGKMPESVSVTTCGLPNQQAHVRVGPDNRQRSPPRSPIARPLQPRGRVRPQPAVPFCLCGQSKNHKAACTYLPSP